MIQIDEDYTTDLTIHIHWTEFVDKHSPIDYYRIGLGSVVGRLDIHNFIFIGEKQGKRIYSNKKNCQNDKWSII